MKRDRILGGRGDSIVRDFFFVLLRGRSPPPPTDHAITAGGAEAPPPSRCDGLVRGGGLRPLHRTKKKVNKLALNGDVAASWAENN